MLMERSAVTDPIRGFLCSSPCINHKYDPPVTTDGFISHQKVIQLWACETENDETLVTAVPNNPGCWTRPIPTSIIMLPFSHPFQLQGHATGPA